MTVAAFNLVDSRRPNDANDAQKCICFNAYFTLYISLSHSDIMSCCDDSSVISKITCGHYSSDHNLCCLCVRWAMMQSVLTIIEHDLRVYPSIL